MRRRRGEREKRRGAGGMGGGPEPGKAERENPGGGWGVGQKGLALTSRTLGAGNDSSPQSSHAHSREIAAKTFCPRAGGSESDPEVYVPPPSLPGGGGREGLGAGLRKGVARAVPQGPGCAFQL